MQTCCAHLSQGLEEKHKLYLYPGGGTMDGVSGDHIIISPPYDITEQNIYALVDMIESLVNDYFKELNSKLEKTGHSEL
jgi:adenosylmethionine-8-amino-7-oxononanoate aminotransferase